MADLENSKDLISVLWSGADILRSKMDANEYKDYLLGIVFYKYLSDSFLIKVYDLIYDEKPETLKIALDAYKEALEDESAEELKEQIKAECHYVIEPELTYTCFADAASGDFHLKSAAGRWNGATWVKDTVTSPCIDAGEASAAYANEPSPNGNRANMGAYGNTAEASKSTSGGSTDPSDPSNPEQRCKHTGTEVRNQKAATCTTAGYTGDTYCKTCNKKLSTGKSIAAKGHSTTTKTQKATASKDGKITTTCTRCGTTTKTVKIAKVSKIKLSKTKYTYNGKKQTPSVTVKDSKGKELKVNADYKVKLPSGRKNVGTYEVKITFKGSKYSGSKTLSYTINPKSTKLSKVSAKKKGFEAKWEKQSTQTKGYQIQYSTDSKFKSGNKTVTVNKNSTTKKTISKLKAKKKYYVRIRTYKTVGKQKYYSDWSKSVKVTTKK